MIKPLTDAKQKHKGNGSTQPSKTKLALKKRHKNGLNTASKSKIPIIVLKAQNANWNIKGTPKIPIKTLNAQEALKTCQSQQSKLDPPEEAKAQHI